MYIHYIGMIMTVGAISSTYTYSTSVQYQYFGTTVSNDRIQDLMKQYGIKQTGDEEYDVQALYEAMMSAASSEAQNTQSISNQGQVQQSQQTDAQNASNVPWADLMEQVGLSVTGNYDDDYDAFNSQIQTMKMSAVNPQQLASISQLEAQASVVFVKSDQSASQGASQSSQNSSVSVSGADILAMLNKMYVYSY